MHVLFKLLSSSLSHAIVLIPRDLLEKIFSSTFITPIPNIQRGFYPFSKKLGALLPRKVCRLPVINLSFTYQHLPWAIVRRFFDETIKQWTNKNLKEE